MAEDYGEEIKLNASLNATDGLFGTQGLYRSALADSVLQKQTPWVQRTSIGKGTLVTNLGGKIDFRDRTGGTSIITYDPVTGTVTINGGIALGQILIGTINNSLIQGTTTLIGTLTSTGLYTGGTISSFTGSQGTFNSGIIGTPAITGGTMNNAVFGTPSITGGTATSSVLNTNTIGTPALTGGTLNPGVYQSGGTAGASGSIVYVKTVNFAGSTTTLGTVNFNNGIILTFN